MSKLKFIMSGKLSSSLGIDYVLRGLIIYRSYGVLLYEIFTLGGTPYPGMTHAQIQSRIRTGVAMEPPASAPNEM